MSMSKEKKRGCCVVLRHLGFLGLLSEVYHTLWGSAFIPYHRDQCTGNRLSYSPLSRPGARFADDTESGRGNEAAPVALADHALIFGSISDSLGVYIHALPGVWRAERYE